MYLSEITAVKPSNRLLYKACDELCFLSKNLYNAVLYIQRQNYQEGKSYIKEWDMNKLLQEQKNPDYYALNTMSSNYVVKQVDENFKSFFSKLKSKKEGSHNQQVNPPSYKDKIKGRNVATFISNVFPQKHTRKKG